MSVTTPLARSKSAALNRVLDVVPKGYQFYTAGEVPIEKLGKLLRKFQERYGIACSPAQRLTRKKKGLANALLVLYLAPDQAPGEATLKVTRLSPEQVTPQSPEELAQSVTRSATDLPADSASGGVPIQVTRAAPFGVRVSWLLLATAGGGAVWNEETLKSVVDDRLQWLGYELVRHPVRGQTSWTWRRPKEAMAELYAVLTELLIRRRPDDVASTLARIARQPGFAGVREQSWRLCEFARQRGYEGELPHLFYLEKIPHGIPLSIGAVTSDGVATGA